MDGSRSPAAAAAGTRLRLPTAPVPVPGPPPPACWGGRGTAWASCSPPGAAAGGVPQHSPCSSPTGGHERIPPPSTHGTELSSATALDSSLCPPPRPRSAIVTPPAPLSPPQPRDSGPAPRVPCCTWVAALCPALTPPGTAPERAAALPPRSETKHSLSAGTSPRKKNTPKHPKNPASPLTRPFCSTAAGGEVLGAWDVVALPL